MSQKRLKIKPNSRIYVSIPSHHPHYMFSHKEEHNADTDLVSRRSRNLKALVRFTHDNMVSATKEAKVPGMKGLLLTQEDSERQPPWDDMVFKNRNRAYGAYVLRKTYNTNLFIGLSITLIVVIFILAYPMVSKLLFGVENRVTPLPRKLVYTELSAPPPIDKPKPPAPLVSLPRLQRVIKFVPPKVVKEEVIQLAPTILEVKESNTGAVSTESPSLVIFDEPVAEIISENDNQLFIVVDQQPEFEGGYAAMMAFIKQNMKYPANARRMQIEGTVHVRFIVNKTGSISDVKVMRGFMTECDQEAVRVVQAMPAWRPGKQNGRSVNVQFILPLKFRLK